MTEQQQTIPQIVILVSPNGSRVHLIDAIKDEYRNWRPILAPAPVPEPQTNGAQPEPTPQPAPVHAPVIEPANVD